MDRRYDNWRENLPPRRRHPFPKVKNKSTPNKTFYDFSAISKTFARRSSVVCIGCSSTSTLSTLRGASRNSHLWCECRPYWEKDSFDLNLLMFRYKRCLQKVKNYVIFFPASNPALNRLQEAGAEAHTNTFYRQVTISTNTQILFTGD